MIINYIFIIHILFIDLIISFIVGPIPLMERGMDYSNIEFLLTLHTITPISELSSSPILTRRNIHSTAKIEIFETPLDPSYSIPSSPTTSLITPNLINIGNNLPYYYYYD